MKSNVFMWKEDRFRLDIRNILLGVQVVRHRDNLPREVVKAPSLKGRLDGTLSSLV